MNMAFVKRWNARLYAVVGWLPFTFGGAIFFLVSLLALWMLGLTRSDLIMVIVGSVGVVLSFIGLMVTLLSGLLCFWQLQQQPVASSLTMVVGEKERTRFSLPMPWWIPLVQMEWTWNVSHFSVELDGKEEVIIAHRRGEWDSIVREISISDGFGICSIRFEHVQRCEIRVLTNTKGLQQPRMVEGLQAGSEFSHPNGHPEGDRIDLRTYAPGDPVRYILWKVYARTGELMVRTPERAYQPAKRMLAYLIVAKEDEVAAGLATIVLQGDLLGKDWYFGVDGVQHPVSERDAAISTVIQSGSSREQQAENINSFLLQAREEGSTLLVFAPARPGPWIQRVLDVAQTLPVRVFVGINGLSNKGLWEERFELLFIPEPNRIPSRVKRSDVNEIIQFFYSSSAIVYIVDQKSGEFFSATHFQSVAS